MCVFEIVRCTCEQIHTYLYVKSHSKKMVSIFEQQQSESDPDDDDDNKCDDRSANP